MFKNFQKNRLSVHYDAIMPLPVITSGNKINFTSLGCPRNLVDTEVMLGILLKSGYEVCEAVEEADFLVINTCSFLEAARREAEETIDELNRRKKKSAKLIICGCMVSKDRSRVETRYPDAHYLIGSGDVEKILEAVQSDQQGMAIGSARSYLEAGEVPRQISTPSHYAYLKIAEGCRKKCAYCQIPEIKGTLRSKPISQVVKEFKILLQQGIEEIILIAQDLGDYGKDWNRREGEFVPLLKELLKIEGKYWLRLLYLYPDEINDELIQLMKSDERICKYLDMPIQHINDEILKRMRRKTDGNAIKQTITKLRQEMPGIHIRTSLIVGFPGETEEQFEELLDFVQEYPLNHVGIFPYSREENTPAALMDNQIFEDIKQKRLKKLAKVQARVAEKLNKKLIGQQLDVVVEGYHPESQLLMTGRFYGQCPEIDGIVIINDTSHVSRFGKRYLVEITGCAGYDLIGRVIRPLVKKRLIQINS